MREESLAAALRRPEEEPCGSMEAMKDGRTRTDGRTDGRTDTQLGSRSPALTRRSKLGSLLRYGGRWGGIQSPQLDRAISEQFEDRLRSLLFCLAAKALT